MFLSVFQDEVVLISGPRNSFCAWTSILACFCSLHKHLFHPCCIQTDALHPNPPWGEGGRGWHSVLQGFPGRLPSLIHFGGNSAPKASPGIWGIVSDSPSPSSTHAPTHIPISLIPAILSVMMLHLAGSSKHSGFTREQTGRQTHWVQCSALTEERPFFKVKPTGFQTSLLLLPRPESSFSFPTCQVGMTHLLPSQQLGVQIQLLMWKKQNSFTELDKCELFT